MMSIQFRHSHILMVKKKAGFSYKADESIKLASDECNLFIAILLILEYMCFLRFVVDIFDVVFFLVF